MKNESMQGVIYSYECGIQLCITTYPIKSLYILNNNKFITSQFCEINDLNADGNTLLDISDSRINKIKTKLENYNRSFLKIKTALFLVKEIEKDILNIIYLKYEWKELTKESKTIILKWSSDIANTFDFRDINNCIIKIPYFIKEELCKIESFEKEWILMDMKATEEIYKKWRNIVRNCLK